MLIHCAWAETFYEQQREKGKASFAAVRAVAFKWIRILFRWWQNKRAYDEARYMASIKKTNCKLWKEIMALALP